LASWRGTNTHKQRVASIYGDESFLPRLRSERSCLPAFFNFQMIFLGTAGHGRTTSQEVYLNTYRVVCRPAPDLLYLDPRWNVLLSSSLFLRTHPYLPRSAYAPPFPKELGFLYIRPFLTVKRAALANSITTIISWYTQQLKSVMPSSQKLE
jgi:hypothetical protein